MLSRIYLTGFMGSGKSTIGPILANTLGWNFFDLDTEIEKKEGNSISRIFEEKGEDYFRRLESEMLSELSSKENSIIALGGGAITFEANLEVLKKTGKTIYLRISPESAYYRLRHKRDRPVLMKNGNMNLGKDEFINKISLLINERKEFYEKADFIIDADKASLGKTVDIIVKIITKEKGS